MNAASSPGFRGHRRLLFAMPVAIAIQTLTLWCASAAPAFAQTISPILPEAVEREQPLHDLTDKSYWINRDDCVADDTFRFDLRVSAWNSYNFEVWAGSVDCTQLSQRTGDLAQCWLVHKGRGEATTFSVELKARDIVAREKPGELDDATVERSVGSRADCDQPWSGSLTLYFMYVDDSGTVSGAATKWSKTGVDINGPSAPSQVAAGVSDESLALHWTSSSSSDLVGYEFYCLEDQHTDAPPEATPSVPTATTASAPLDASLADAASADAAAASSGMLDAATSSVPVDNSGTCGEGLLVAGEFPSTNGRVFRCGTLSSKTATKGYATGLSNGVAYAVGVAGIDDLGNPGPLANVVCETPQYVKQFYSDYRNRGGKGGGGFCSLRVGTPEPHWVGLWLAAGAFCFLRFRRRL